MFENIANFFFVFAFFKHRAIGKERAVRGGRGTRSRRLRGRPLLDGYHFGLGTPCSTTMVMVGRNGARQPPAAIVRLVVHAAIVWLYAHTVWMSNSINWDSIAFPTISQVDKYMTYMLTFWTLVSVGVGRSERRFVGRRSARREPVGIPRRAL